MGTKPYYEKTIPKDHIYNNGVLVCNFKKRKIISDYFK